MEDGVTGEIVVQNVVEEPRQEHVQTQHQPQIVEPNVRVQQVRLATVMHAQVRNIKILRT